MQFLHNVIDITASLNGIPIKNHEFLYYDEIGFTQADGLVCDGIASNICCKNFEHFESGGRNGIGSWIAPDGTYICTDCVGAEMDPFQVHRTANATVLYRIKNSMPQSGIYRCEIPLSLNFTNNEPLIHYFGIYERGKGN